MDVSNNFSVMMDDHDGTHHHYHDAASTHHHQHQHHHHFDSSSTMEPMSIEPLPPSETIDATAELYHNDNVVNMDGEEASGPDHEKHKNEEESPVKREEKGRQPQLQVKDDEKRKENDDEMTIEERQIHDSLLQQRQDAHAKLQATLVRVHETTKTMLNEIGHFLESTESVMIDYTKCQNSQREEARRLEEVEPDVAGATERYLAQVQGMMMQK